MADLTSRLIVRLVDGVTAPARAAAASLKQLQRAGQATVALGRPAVMARNVRQMGKSGAEAGRAMSLPMTLLGTMAGRAVYQFEKAGNAMQAVTGITDEQRKSLENYSKELNALFPFTNKEILEAAFELGRAGLTFEQIMGSLKETLNLSLAGDIGLKQSADIATNVMTAMRLPMKTAEDATKSLIRVNDVLAYVATSSNTDVGLMGETLKYVGPIAAAAGLSLEEVGAASMVMARAGIRGSEAGVAMRSALVRMVRPTRPMIAALSRLNVNIADFVKGGRQIAGSDVVKSLLADGVDASAYVGAIDKVLQDPKLQKSTAAMTQRIVSIIEQSGSVLDRSKLAESVTETLTAAGSDVDFFGFIEALREKGATIAEIASIFDVRQGSRLATLLTQNLFGVLEQVTKNATGKADEMAKTRMKGLVGAIAELVAAMENMSLVIGESGIRDDVIQIANAIRDWANALKDVNPLWVRFGTWAAVAVAALAPIAIVFAGIAAGARVVTAALRVVIGILMWIGRGAIVGFLLNPLSWIVLAIAGVVAAAIYFRQEIVAAFNAAIEWAKNAWEAIKSFHERIAAAFRENGGAAGLLYNAGAALMKSLWEGMKSIGSQIVGWASGLAGRIGGAITGAASRAWEGAKGLVGAGGSTPQGRALGGNVTRGRAYIVGERRPELFVPGQSGTIHPTTSLGGGGGVTVSMNPVFHINGAHDPTATAREVNRLIRRELGELLRGLQGDIGVGFA